MSRPALGYTQPPIQWPGPTVEVKNKRSQTDTPPICLHDMDSDGFTSTLPTISVKEELSLILSKKIHYHLQ